MTSYSLLLLLTPSYSIRTKMKFIPYLFLILLFIGCTSKPKASSEEPSKPKRATTTIEWLTETKHDFGVYTEREPKSFDFVYRNTGTIPFAIDSVLTSCGCTGADYVKRPVLPGKTDTIHVTYYGNGFMPGIFHQRCCIFANIDESPICLEIKGIFDHAE